MHIDQIRVLYLAMPRAKPEEFGTRRLTTCETVLVGMSSGGVTGWGEASPGTVPEAASEWAHGAFLCLKEWLAPELLGAELPTGDVAPAAAGPRFGQCGRQSGLGHRLVEFEGAAGTDVRWPNCSAPVWPACRWDRSSACKARSTS